MNLSATTLGQIGTFMLGISAVVTLILTYSRREWIGAWLRDRRDLQHEISGLRQSVTEAELHAKAASLAVGVQATTITAQSETIDLMRVKITELEDVKNRFTALMRWIPLMLEYVAFLERIVTPLQRAGRSMPPLPPSLVDDVRVAEETA